MSQFAIDQRLMEMETVAIVTMDRMAAVVKAAEIRRAGIACETYYTGNFKKQMARSSNFGAVVIVNDNGIEIKDMLTGVQRPLVGDLVEAVRDVLFNGYYEDEQ